jgi:thioredoxin 1
MSSIAVTDSDFEKQVIEADETVMVDFWAEWCGPCKALSPLVDEVANEMKDKIDESPEAPTKYGVRGIPTLMLFKNGQVVDTKVGGMPKTQLVEWIEETV